MFTQIPLLAFLGGWELAVIAVVMLLLFGTRLPKVARSLGQSVTEFKSGLHEDKNDGSPDGSDGSATEPK